MSFSALSHLVCSVTDKRYEADAVQGVSEAGKPLLARYDLEQVAATVTPREIASRPPTLWRYHEVLPVREEKNVVSLGEGMTPLVPAPSYGRQIGVGNCSVFGEQRSRMYALMNTCSCLR